MSLLRPDLAIIAENVAPASRVLDRVLLIGICSWLLWGRGKDAPFPIIWFAWAQTLAYGITALVALALVIRHMGVPRPRLDLPFIREVLRQSAPYALLVLLIDSSRAWPHKSLNHSSLVAHSGGGDMMRTCGTL